jgi:hypothetical protein
LSCLQEAYIHQKTTNFTPQDRNFNFSFKMASRTSSKKTVRKGGGSSKRASTSPYARPAAATEEKAQPAKSVWLQLGRRDEPGVVVGLSNQYDKASANTTSGLLAIADLESTAALSEALQQARADGAAPGLSWSDPVRDQPLCTAEAEYTVYKVKFTKKLSGLTHADAGAAPLAAVSDLARGSSVCVKVALKPWKMADTGLYGVTLYANFVHVVAPPEPAVRALVDQLSEALGGGSGADGEASGGWA